MHHIEGAAPSGFEYCHCIFLENDFEEKLVKLANNFEKYQS